MRVFANRQWYIKSPLYQKMLVESMVIGGILLTFMPPSLALFPQFDSVKAKYLEKKSFNKIIMVIKYIILIKDYKLKN